ncbi:MAG: hypothetical protein ABIO35_00355 [Nitrobacter sp.]
MRTAESKIPSNLEGFECDLVPFEGKAMSRISEPTPGGGIRFNFKDSCLLLVVTSRHNDTIRLKAKSIP